MINTESSTLIPVWKMFINKKFNSKTSCLTSLLLITASVFEAEASVTLVLEWVHYIRKKQLNKRDNIKNKALHILVLTA